MVSFLDKEGSPRPALMADDPLILGRRDLLGFYSDTLLAGAHDRWGFVPSGSTLSGSGLDGPGSSAKVPGGGHIGRIRWVPRTGEP